MPHIPPYQPTRRHAAAITAILALLSIFPPLATDMYLPAIGTIANALHTSHAATELSLSLFFLGLCVGQVIMGPMIDSFGRKAPLMAGTALYALCSALLPLVRDVVLFDALRFFQAIGACAGMVVGRAVVNDLYDGQRAAKAMTVLVMLMTVGPIISPTLGSLLLQGFGWQSIFVVMLAVGIVALVLSAAVIPETLPPAARLRNPMRSAARTAGGLLRRRDYAVPVLVAGLVQGGMFAFITGSSGVFQGEFGLDSLAYGLTFAVIAAALFLFGQLNHRLLDHFTAARILGAGLPLYVLAGALLALASGTGSLWLLVVPLWLSIGMVGLLSANAMAITMAAAREGAGTGSALLGTVQFGMAFTVSACVALGGSDSALPMSLGILIPALLAWALWSGGRRRQAAPSAP
ncbi:multidrug effflux MFS transporter [Acidimangrovimonas sediminis]|uniref:multidrug effflux MFS transporter n=1 Tax=Acidimangrovimonas sediminis TaxID=2056283 RepID=UPI000C8020F2|nr:multidrug effflux MFS transporter [Acidimangrovimonas sediminis]